MGKFIVFAMTLACFLQQGINAQEPASKEAGAYERKSVTYINALWLLDESVHRLSSEKVGMLLSKVQSGISMSRFDYNPIPDSYVSDFVKQANELSFPPTTELAMTQGADPMLDSITAIMQRTVVPKILEAVDLAKEARAANLTSEQQRNSFISDKAKTMGITMEDVEKVMNSAYIYIPLIRGYSSIVKDSLYTTDFAAGIIWFRIETKDGKSQAVPVVKKFTYSSGYATINKAYPTSEGLVDYKDFAFNSAVKNAVRNLVSATQEIAEFKLSAQVIEQGFMSVGFNLGKREGLHIDDKYSIVETIEDGSGKQTQKKNGWIMVTSVADTNSKQGYKSKGQVIAGNPYIGATLSEFPRIPIDLIIKGKMLAYTLDSLKSSSLFDTTTKLTNGYGVGIDVLYNIGRGMGIGQLFLGIGGTFGVGMIDGSKVATVNNTDRHGKAVYNGAYSWSGEIALTKKFYLGRVALMLQPEIGYQSVMLFTDKSYKATNSSGEDEYYRLTNATLGFAANGGLEFALSPSVNLGVGGGYQLYGNSNTWSYDVKKGTSDSYTSIASGVKDSPVNHTGITAQLYITWSPPALAFDPVDMARGMSGL